MTTPEDPLVDRLLADLRDEDENIRQQATAQLWTLWFSQKGMQGLERLRQARELVEGSEIAAAEDLLTEVVRDLPDFAEAWNQRAILYYALGRYRQAEEDCRRAVELVPYHFGAWHGLGLCHIALGEHRAAIEALQQAADIQPHAGVNRRLILECTLQLDT